MGSPEYITTDWLKELKCEAEDLRREAQILEARARQIDSLRAEFAKRLAEHEKWRQKPEGDAP